MKINMTIRVVVFVIAWLAFAWWRLSPVDHSLGLGSLAGVGVSAIALYSGKVLGYAWEVRRLGRRIDDLEAEIAERKLGLHEQP